MFFYTWTISIHYLFLLPCLEDIHHIGVALDDSCRVLCISRKSTCRCRNSRRKIYYRRSKISQEDRKIYFALYSIKTNSVKQKYECIHSFYLLAALTGLSNSISWRVWWGIRWRIRRRRLLSWISFLPRGQLRRRWYLPRVSSVWTIRKSLW